MFAGAAPITRRGGRGSSATVTHPQTALQRFARDWMAGLRPEGRCRATEATEAVLTAATVTQLNGLYLPIYCHTLGGLAHGPSLIRVRQPTLEGTHLVERRNLVERETTWPTKVTHVIKKSGR